MKLYSYRIFSFVDITERRSHGKAFRFKAELVPTDMQGTVKEKSETIQLGGTIEFGRYPIRGWPELYKNKNKDINEENVRKVMFEYARLLLENELKQEELNQSFAFSIHKSIRKKVQDTIVQIDNTPETCPFEAERIGIDFNRWYPIEISRRIGF